MRHTMFQEHRTLGSAKDFVIYGHGSHLGHASKTIFTKFTFRLSKRALHKVLPRLVKRFRESCLKIMIMHMYIAPGQGQKTPCGKSFCSKI